MTAAKITNLSELNKGAFATWYAAGTNAVMLAHAMRAALRSPYSPVKVTGTDLVLTYKGAERPAWRKLGQSKNGNSEGERYFRLVAACGFVVHASRKRSSVAAVTLGFFNNLRYAEGLQVERVRREMAEWEEQTGDTLPLLSERES